MSLTPFHSSTRMRGGATRGRSWPCTGGRATPTTRPTKDIPSVSTVKSATLTTRSCFVISDATISTAISVMLTESKSTTRKSISNFSFLSSHSI